MKTLGFVLLFTALLSFGQDQTFQPQLTQVPPKPTCTPILSNGACANLWQAYNQAWLQRQQEELQIYVERQKQLASAQAAEQATAPLQEQIEELNKMVSDQQDQIRKLTEQMQANATAATRMIEVTRSTGLRAGMVIGALGVLVLMGLVFGIRKLMQNFSVVKKPQVPA